MHDSGPPQRTPRLAGQVDLAAHMSLPLVLNVVGSSVYATVRCFISKIITSKGGPGGEERPLWFAACTKCGKKALGEESSGFSCEVCASLSSVAPGGLLELSRW